MDRTSFYQKMPTLYAFSGQSLPFQVRFVSDEGEGAMETIQSGFQLGYIQTSV